MEPEEARANAIAEFRQGPPDLRRADAYPEQLKLVMDCDLLLAEVPKI